MMWDGFWCPQCEEAPHEDVNGRPVSVLLRGFWYKCVRSVLCADHGCWAYRLLNEPGVERKKVRVPRPPKRHRKMWPIIERRKT